MDRRSFLASCLTLGIAPSIVRSESTMPGLSASARAAATPAAVDGTNAAVSDAAPRAGVALKPATPLDEPFPDYEVAVPIRGGCVAVADAFAVIDKNGGRGRSVTLRFPPGMSLLPSASDRSFRVDYTNRSDETTQIVFAGARDGTTVLKGSPGSSPTPMRLASGCIGTWRMTDMQFLDIIGHAMTFGTGPYNQKKNIVVLQRLSGKYCTGNWIMAAAEQAGPSTRFPSPMVINDELWMEDLDFRYSTYEHCFYIDQRAYVFGRRLKLYNGPLHAFKCTALKTELEDCFFFNVDPGTGDAVSIAPGVSAVYPKGATFYGRNANMSLVSACGGHAKNVRCLHAWPASQVDDAGTDVVERQPRWALATANPELIDPSDRNWWVNARAAGVTDPRNPYLLKHRWLWENCTFEQRVRPDRSPPNACICVVSATPIDGSKNPTAPIPVHFPDLWFNRSRDYALNCRFIAGNSKTVHFRQSAWFDPVRFPADWARCSADAANLYTELKARPAWWPADFDYHA